MIKTGENQTERHAGLFGSSRRVRRLSVEETDLLLNKLAELHTAGLPLSAGFRAAAGETRHGKLARTLRYWADRLEQGVSLEQLLSDSLQGETNLFSRRTKGVTDNRSSDQTRPQGSSGDAGWQTSEIRSAEAVADTGSRTGGESAAREAAPDVRIERAAAPLLAYQVYSSGLIAVALRHRDLGAALEMLLDHQRQMRETASQVVGSLAYPIAILLLTCLMIGLLGVWVVPVFGEMFNEFGLTLPPLTQAVMRLSDLMVHLSTDQLGWTGLSLLGLLLVLLVGYVAGECLGWFGPRQRHDLLSSVPLIGPIFSWLSAVGWARLLALLIEREVPLPTALRLTSEGLIPNHLRNACWRLAEQVEQGGDLATLLEQEMLLPTTLVPFIRTGLRQGTLPDALRTAAELLLHRVQLRASIFQLVAPSLLFLFIGCLVTLVTLALFLPFTSMISALR